MPTPPAKAVTQVRRSERFRVNFAIKLFAVVHHRKCVLQGRSHDICEDGMAIYIPAELERGQMVQVEFLLPNSQQRLGIGAIVRDCQGFRCGIQFDHLTAAERHALEQCCERLAISK
jgi:c-di-GMP-binding flagellar brake protein YcgR